MKTRLLTLLLAVLLSGCQGEDEVGRVVRPGSASSAAAAAAVADTPSGGANDAAGATARPDSPAGDDRADRAPAVPETTSPGAAAAETAQPAAALSPSEPLIAPTPTAPLPPPPEVPTHYADQDPNSYVAVQSAQSGEPFVVVNHPWQTYRRPSVQVLWVDDPADLESRQPIPLDGDELLKRWNQQIRELLSPAIRSSEYLFDYGERQILAIHGQYNALNKPSAYGVDQAARDRGVFYRPDTWANERGVFYAGLSDLKQVPVLQKPGKLRVWVLDEEQVVAAETLDWPGSTGAPAPAETAEVAGPGNAEEDPAVQPVGPEMAATEGPAVASPEPSDGGPSEEAIAPPAAEPTEEAGPAMEVPPSQDGEPTAPAESPTEPTPTPPPEPSRAAPREPAGPATPAEINWRTAPIDQLVGHVERLWGDQMSPAARQSWAKGVAYYRQAQNPADVRLFYLRRMVKAAYEDETSDAVRKGLDLLYQRLRNDATAQ